VPDPRPIPNYYGCNRPTRDTRERVSLPFYARDKRVLSRARKERTNRHVEWRTCQPSDILYRRTWTAIVAAKRIARTCGDIFHCGYRIAPFLRMETAVLWAAARQLCIFRMSLIYLLFLTFLPHERGTKRNLGTFNARVVSRNASFLSTYTGRRDESETLSPTKFVFYNPKYTGHASSKRNYGKVPNMHIYRDV